MANNKNTSYPLLGLILFAASCSQEIPQGDTGLDSHGRIEFKASLPEISSRASEVTSSNLGSFQVSAFKVAASSETPYFSEKAFSRNSVTGRYVCSDPECIWPNNNDVLRFVSFAPSCDVMNIGGGVATLTGDMITGFKVPQDIASHFDFVTAINCGRLLENEDSEIDETFIDLAFRHQLSRIQLKAWGKSPSFDIEIAGVRLGGVATGGSFSLKAAEGVEGSDPAPAGEWVADSKTKGYVQYIFGAGDRTVTLDGKEGNADADSIAAYVLYAKSAEKTGTDNSAMVIPSVNRAWNYKDNPTNLDGGRMEGMYISVLLRVKDKTPYASGDGYVYPSENDQAVYLAVDEEDGKTVKTRVYRHAGAYYSDEAHTQVYDESENGAVVKAYGWAALPVGGELKPGRIYTYNLNYSNGVGLRDPEDTNPGTSIISDKVIVAVSVDPWVREDDNNVQVPRR